MVGRDLDLSETEAIELFDLLAQQTRPFTLELAGLPGKRAMQASIVDSDPVIPLAIRPFDKGGYLIERGGDIAIAAQGDRMYLWCGGALHRCSREFSRCADFLRTVYDSDNERLIVSKQDMPLFCATVLPLLESTLHVQAPQELEAFKPVPCELEFYFDKDDEVVICNAWAAYRDQRFLLCGADPHAKNGGHQGAPESAAENDDEVEPLRDERKEQRAVNLVERYLGGIAAIPLDDDEGVANLLFGGLAEFRTQGDVFTTPAFDRLISDKKPKVTLGVSLAGNLIDLTVSAGDLPKHELSALLGSYRKRKRFHKLKSGAHLDLQGFDLSQLDRLASDLGITTKQLAAGHAELPTYRAFYLDEEVDLERDRSFLRYLENFRAVDEAAYDLLRIDIDDYEGRTFYCCALDEAQYIKNPATLTTRATKRIEAQQRFALTGTPLENRLSELWSIFDFLMPGLLGPYARFRDRFEEPIVGGDDAVAQRLQAAVGPFMLRRLKEDVLADLPEKLESVVYVPLEGEQKKLYAAHEQQLRESLTVQHNTRKERDAGKRKVEILAELTKLRQLCCDPGLLYENYAGGAAKLDAIMELVEAAQDAGEKTLVFSQFTSFLSRIDSRLDARATSYFTITGATPKKRRLQLVNAFNEDDTPVFLISLKAGGTGLNLAGASVVIHADPWWNEAAQAQVADRAQRIAALFACFRVLSALRFTMWALGNHRERRLDHEKTRRKSSQSIPDSKRKQNELRIQSNRGDWRSGAFACAGVFAFGLRERRIE